ncbi:copper chaperone PCu(A)C [uncultured Roseobacter sp.]|uniref:copper chaperone PCu(A)C n=1 Tax=uncultured Roseobacter sp. TaxID=114847 RepID=UPI00261600D0|nr:copper chaperone PCu(A)C [uncultured Roseobacter sp.]
MSFQTFLRGAALSALCVLPGAALAGDIVITDAYARVSRPNAPTGAAFMMIRNAGSTDDRLVSVTSDVAKRVELHTHKDQGDGVMKMTELEDGIILPAGAAHMMKRGGDHVMFMGIEMPLEQGSEVIVVFTFEKAGEVSVTIPVDNERKPEHTGMSHDHSKMDHGATD